MFRYDEPFGSVVFCDDIRPEIGGKVSYMGVYTGALYVPSFPISVPKFGIVTTFLEPFEMALKREAPVLIRIFVPGDSEDKPTIQGELPPIHQTVLEAAAKTKLPDDPDVPKLAIMNAGFVLAPLNLLQPGRIKVRAFYGDRVIKLGSLKIETPPDASEVIGAGSTVS